MLTYFSKVLYVLEGKRKGLVLLLFIFTLTSVLEALGIGLIGPFLSIAGNPESIHKISSLNWVYQQLKLQSTIQVVPILGIGIAAIFCLKSLLYFLSWAKIYQYSADLNQSLITKLLSAYLTVPYTFHLNRNTANLIKNILIETTTFTASCILPLLKAAVNLIVLLCLFLLLAKTDLLLLAMIMVILLPIFILFNLLGNKFKKWGKIKSESKQEMVRILNHGLGGLKETRVIGCESYFQEQMANKAQQFAQADSLFSTSQMLPRILIETALIVFIMLFISLSIIFLKQDMQEITGIMGVFAIASMRLIPAASQLFSSINQLRNSNYAVNMLYLDLKEISIQGVNQLAQLPADSSANSAVNSSKERAKTLTFSGSIELDRITYSYHNSPKLAVEDISLKIKKGQSIALIGKSGSGKTTLVDIILGLLEPNKGDILVDGKSIYNNLRSWQNMIGYIPQSIFLIDDTVERNIAFGVSDLAIDPVRMDKALQAAQLEELITQLPKGIKTEVGERGVRLSGGQRQRIGIARALYHEREILVLDEATSALDNETERLVSEAIKSLAGTKTLIIIAHRLSTVEHCDRVYLMEKGHVIQSGSYQEVVVSKMGA
ncbi:ABC transporter ATP-binding protein [Pleurocapsa sp. CCALA 161]|uniref:ABC transporter ATP-binding protein n=1 Tax=Pleurocapsa sp. CCALA 161 TaxID=2107688 RepID=UPI000D074C2B|nr:ABC transporter ATP-binding protein [Pleurocapsa sp. CCALA 161]PSB08073.1 ABC transporter ATP-binding protein [Pleurocapsa sp. CCALA 161]